MNTLSGLREKSPINSFYIKIAAIIFMFIDHFAVAIIMDEILYDGANTWNLYMFLRALGRFSFPVYCFFIVEGYKYTHDVEAYIKRLIIFGVISEIPFDMAIHGQVIALSGCNVFFTLALGLIVITVVDRYPLAKDIWLRLMVCMLCFGIAYLINTDYSFVGVALIAIFYFLRNNRMLCALAGSIFIFLEDMEIAVIIPMALFFIAIVLYNGQRGRQMKYFFYAFYPLHLLVLGIIRVWM